MIEQLALPLDGPAPLPSDIQARLDRLGCRTLWRDHENDAIGGWVAFWPDEDPDGLLGFTPAYEGCLREWLDWAEAHR